MKKIILIIGGILLLAGGGFFLFRIRGGGGGEGVLKVTATPTATIFLDERNIGKTPYEGKYAAGEYTLKLVPETTVESLVSWEEKVTLRPSLLTYVNQELGASDLSTQGEVLTLDKSTGSGAELAILSSPDGANVTLNGENKGTTPLVLKDLPADNFVLSVAASGFAARTVKVKTTAGYKLTASFQLATSGEVAVSPSPSLEELPAGTPKATPKASPKTSPSPSPKTSALPGASPTAKPASSPPPKPYVEILDTPTGFLRVREEPSTETGKEVSRVNPGEYYTLLDETTVSGTTWYKIEYEPEKEGFISGQYAKKYE